MLNLLLFCLKRLQRYEYFPDFQILYAKYFLFLIFFYIISLFSLLLYLHREALNGKGKRLRTNDEQMLRDAEKLLNDEFALVLNIKPREVPEYIRSRLEEAS